MTAWLVTVEDADERPALLILEADDIEEACRRVRALLAADAPADGPIRSSLTPAMAERLA